MRPVDLAMRTVLLSVAKEGYEASPRYKAALEYNNSPVAGFSFQQAKIAAVRAGLIEERKPKADKGVMFSLTVAGERLVDTLKGRSFKAVEASAALNMLAHMNGDETVKTPGVGPARQQVLLELLQFDRLVEPSTTNVQQGFFTVSMDAGLKLTNHGKQVLKQRQPQLLAN